MKDKLKHFLVCAIISILTLGTLLLLGTNWSGYEKLLALSLGVGAALAKEMIWDKWLHLGTPEFYDFVAGLFGAFAGTFIWIIIETIILEICH